MSWGSTRSRTQGLTRRTHLAHLLNRPTVQTHITLLERLHVPTLPLHPLINQFSPTSLLLLILYSLSHNHMQTALLLVLLLHCHHHSSLCSHLCHPFHNFLRLSHPTPSQPSNHLTFQPHHLSLCSHLGSSAHCPCSSPPCLYFCEGLTHCSSLPLT